MIAINPKLEFKLRTLQNWIVCIIGFILWAILISPFPFRWIGDIAGIAVAYYVLFFVLDKRASLIACPHCKKQVATNTPWVCGVCGKNNLRVEDFPFTHRCEYCGIEPKSYQCHHPECGGLIFFTEDNQQVNYARCLNPKEQVAPQDKRVVRGEEKEERQHAIDLEELDAKLEMVRKLREMGKKKEKTLDEEIQDDLEHTYTRFIGVEAHARKKKAEADEEYKDDPEMRQKAHDLIDAWVRQKTP